MSPWLCWDESNESGTGLPGVTRPQVAHCFGLTSSDKRELGIRGDVAMRGKPGASERYSSHDWSIEEKLPRQLVNYREVEMVRLLNDLSYHTPSIHLAKGCSG